MSFNLVAVAPVFRKIMCRPYSLYRSIYTIHVSWTTLDYPSAIRSWHCVTQECQEKRRGSRCRCGNCGYGLGRTVRNRPLFQVVTAEPTSKHHANHNKNVNRHGGENARCGLGGKITAWCYTCTANPHVILWSHVGKPGVHPCDQVFNISLHSSFHRTGTMRELNQIKFKTWG